MLRLAFDVAVAATRGARYQRVGSRANVRLLLIVRTREAAAVEEIGDGLSNYPVRV